MECDHVIGLAISSDRMPGLVPLSDVDGPWYLPVDEFCNCPRCGEDVRKQAEEFRLRLLEREKR